MFIIFSSFRRGVPQIDSRYFVTETHRDVFGVDHEFSYLSDFDFDNDRLLQSRAAELEKSLVSEEAGQLVSQDTPSRPRYGTIRDTLGLFAETFSSSQGVETARLARWFFRGLEERLFDELLAQEVFKIMGADWDSFRAEVSSLREAFDKVSDAKGEDITPARVIVEAELVNLKR